DKLMADGYQADALHGDLSQPQRDYVMGRFRKKNIQLLVATDVAARGIDVNDLTHVLHFKIPDQLEYYIHRSGRTGRAGKKGTSIALLTGREIYKIRTLEKTVGQKFERRLIPTGEQVCEKRLFELINKIATYNVDESIDKYLPTVYEQLSGFTKEEILQKFVSLEFTRVLSYYKNASDLNVTNKRDERKNRDRNRERDNNNDRKNNHRNNNDNVSFSRFYINVGSKHKLTAPRMIGLINDSLSFRGIEIGKIEILKSFSFFEIDGSYEKKLLDGFQKGMQVAGVNVVVEKTQEKSQSYNKSGSPKFKKPRKDFRPKSNSKPRFSKSRKKKKRY
ncbi:helicase-related protein, partial [Aureispira]|nr:helicase-related protein [Aureispira sp.]